jgi:hypothetical protein
MCELSHYFLSSKKFVVFGLTILSYYKSTPKICHLPSFPFFFFFFLFFPSSYAEYIKFCYFVSSGMANVPLYTVTLNGI